MQKLLIVLLFSLFFALKTNAQTPKDTTDYPYWIDMMQNENVNYFSVQKAFYKYYEKHGKKEREKNEENEQQEEQFAIYFRWEYITRKRIKSDGTRIKSSETLEEISKYRRIHK